MTRIVGRLRAAWAAFCEQQEPPAVLAGRAIVEDGQVAREAALGRAVLDAASNARLHGAEVWVQAHVYGCAVIIRPPMEPGA